MSQLDVAPSASAHILHHVRFIPRSLRLALVPFLARLRTWQLCGVIAMSTLSRIVGYRFGLADDPWHARFFPFELALFCLGMIAERWRGWLGTGRLRPVGVCAAVLAIVLSLFFYPILARTPVACLYQKPDYWHSLALYALVFVALPELFRATQHSVFHRFSIRN